MTLPAGEVLGGTAFSSVLIGVTGTAPDVALSGFRFETTSQPLPTGYSHAEYGEISTNSPVGVRFVRESLTLVGQAQEVVRLHPPPFSRSDYYPFAGSVSVPNVPLSALRCGLRYVKFDVGGRGQDMKLGAFSAGLDSIDCGWDPSVSFVGFGFWDWRLSDPLDFNATPPYVEQYLGNFGVEATRLP